jgi:hypothetical protein
MKTFDTSIRQMLWPETRLKDPILAPILEKNGYKGPSFLYRTTAKSYITASTGILPGVLAELVDFAKLFLPWATDQDGLKVGPIPQGFPVGLLSNLDLDPGGENLSLGQKWKRDELRIKLLAKTKLDLKNAKNLSDDELRKKFDGLTDLLLQLSKCPDLVVNRGHYFGTDMLAESEHEPGLSNSDKEALIAFLKTF